MPDLIKKTRISAYSKRNKNKLYFKEITKEISKKEFSLIDLGCASGDFIEYVRNKKKNLNNIFYGIEKYKYLLKFNENNKKKNIFYINTNFLNKKFSLKKKFDYVICLGTINLFEDLNKIFKIFFKLVKKNGKIIIYDVFNDNPINLRLKVNFEGSNKWISQQNAFSEKYIQRLCKKINPKAKINFKKINFNKINVKKEKYPSLRSYTAKVKGVNYFISPYNQILNFKILTIKNN